MWRLQIFWHSIWNSTWHCIQESILRIFWHCIWHSIRHLAFYISDTWSDILSGILSDKVRSRVRVYWKVAGMANNRVAVCWWVGGLVRLVGWFVRWFARCSPGSLFYNLATLTWQVGTKTYKNYICWNSIKWNLRFPTVTMEVLVPTSERSLP